MEGSTWVPSDLHDRPLTGLARMIFSVLLGWEQHGNPEDPPTIKTLYRYFPHDSKRQIQKAVQTLQDIGMLELRDL